MKLALLSSGLGYTNRGVENWMLDVARLLRHSDISVELWSGGALRAPEGVRHLALRAIDRRSSALGWLSWAQRYEIEQLSMLPQAIALLRARRVDVAYCGDPVLAWHLKRFRKAHASRVVFMNGMRLSVHWSRDFDGVHLLAPVYADAARQALPERFSQRVFAVPHFADIDRFHPPTCRERNAARAKLGLAEQDLVLLNLGPVGHISGKRQDFLARAVAEAGRPCVLLCAGPDEPGGGEVRARAVQAMGAKVRFLGMVPREQIPRLMHAADLYALGALAEPFSIAVLEAMASGLPVLHHDEPVLNWQAGAGGSAVPLDQVQPVGEVLRDLYDNRAELQALGRAARELSVRRYAPRVVCEDLAENLLRVYRSARLS